jgi:ribose 5-phosphate isomerase A
VLADYGGEIDEPARLAAQLSAVPGVISHGLFPPSLVSTVLIARGETVESIRPG